MLKTAAYSLYVLAGLSFLAMGVDRLEPYSSILMPVILNGIGLGTILRTLHGYRVGRVYLPPRTIRREEHGLLFGVGIAVLFLIGLVFEVFGLLIVT